MSIDTEDQGHSINDDYRMAGLHGDDETDLEDDREELFGSATNPVEVGDTTGDGATGAVNGKRKRNATSRA
jgi:hypothetical protein